MTNSTARKQVKNVKVSLADIKGYSRNLFLAGLGVYNTTEQQRSKNYKAVVNTTSNIFKELVKAGEGLEKKGKKLVDENVKTVNKQLETVKNSVSEQIEKLKTAANSSKAPVKAAVKKAPAKTAAKAPARKAPVRKAPVKAAIVTAKA
jgi:DNA-binding transcriptional regulator GbsR (MarR family)